MTNKPTLTLRERKRRETRARLEEAAVALVLSEGLEHATVNAISARADVSPRTFFNYFDSKDDAILGLRLTPVSDQDIAGHLARYGDHPLVESVVHLLISVTGVPRSNPAIRADRMTIISRYPQLLADQMAQMTQLTGRLAEAVEVLLPGSSDLPGVSEADRAVQAELILALCVAAVRISVREWAAAATEVDENELEQRATTLVHALVEGLR